MKKSIPELLSLLLDVSSAGKPVMIITEYMENGSLDTFLKVRPRSWKILQGLNPDLEEEKKTGTTADLPESVPRKRQQMEKVRMGLSCC